MKIAYVTTFDARLENSWSGTGYRIAKALENQGAEICYVGPLAEKNAFYYKAKQLFYREILNKRHIRQAEPTILLHNADQITKQINHLNPDIVLGIWAYPIAFLHCKQPIAFIADATFPLMKDYYDDYNNVSDETLKNVRAMEKSALERSAAIIYSSEWASKSAERDYGIDPNKVHTVPFGANITSEPTEQEVESYRLSREKNPVCNLLFLGVDWNRKGGDIACTALQILRSRGIDAKLTICGCIPPKEYLNSHVTVIPFLDKSNHNENEAFKRLLIDAHFLLLPTRKEAYGLVFCEASAYGLPSVTTDTGGVTEIIHHDKNGYALPLNAGAGEYADIIETLWTNKIRYSTISKLSRIEYINRLNWRIAGNKMIQIFQSLL